MRLFVYFYMGNGFRGSSQIIYKMLARTAKLNISNPLSWIDFQLKQISFNKFHQPLSVITSLVTSKMNNLCVWVTNFSHEKYTCTSIYSQLFDLFFTSFDIMPKLKSTQKQKVEKANIIESISKLENEILAALSQKNRYGLEIVKVFEKASAGERTIGLSTLYTVLARLEEHELVQSKIDVDRTSQKGGAKRKYFQITTKGIKQLHKQELFLERVIECEVFGLQPA